MAAKSQQQNDTLLPPLDSQAIEKEVDAFLYQLQSLQQQESYFFVGTGVGNRQFSTQNLVLNSQQANAQLVLTPTAGYMHKSGWGLSYTGYVGTAANAGGFLQHAITASYTLPSANKTDAGIFYTVYVGKKDFINTTSPYQHDVFAYVNAQSGALQPGLAVGWAGGKFTNTLSIDTFRIVMVNNQPVRVPFTILDTSVFRVADFSLIGTLKHTFHWKGWREDHDITFTPQFMVSLASSSTKTVSSTTLLTNRRFLLSGTRFDNRRFQTTSSNTAPLDFQSLGLSLDATYYIHQFYFNPQLYVDYYLKSTNASRFTALFNLQLGFYF